MQPASVRDSRLSELANQAANGDLDAAEAWIRELHGPLISFLYLLGIRQEDVEDLAQEICLRMYRNLSKYDRQSPFLPWMHTIARNHVRNHWRDRQRRDQHHSRFHEFVVAQAAQTDDEPAVPVEVDILQKCIEKLPDNGRTLIRLRYEKGLNASQIGAELSRSSVSVRKSLSRLYDALRSCVESHGSQFV